MLTGGRGSDKIGSFIMRVEKVMPRKTFVNTRKAMLWTNRPVDHQTNKPKKKRPTD